MENIELEKHPAEQTYTAIKKFSEKMPYRIIIFNQPDKGINIADLVLEPSRAEQRNIKEEEILNYLYNRHYYNGIMQYLPDDCIDILHEFHIWN